MINNFIEKNNSSTFFILAGEQSADNHGAALMQSIQALNHHAEFTGIGGKKMVAAGLKSLEDIDKLAVMGFVEVIKHLSFFWKLTNRVLEEIKSVQPMQIILIDCLTVIYSFVPRLKIFIFFLDFFIERMIALIQSLTCRYDFF